MVVAFCRCVEYVVNMLSCMVSYSAFLILVAGFFLYFMCVLRVVQLKYSTGTIVDTEFWLSVAGYFIGAQRLLYRNLKQLWC